jgi:hypothetical protein
MKKYFFKLFSQSCKFVVYVVVVVVLASSMMSQSPAGLHLISVAAKLPDSCFELSTAASSSCQPCAQALSFDS